jgi:hypothetical protein
LVVGEQHIFVGCADGIVRCFSPFTLQFVTTLPRTHYLGVDVAKGLSISHMASHPANAKYPDTVALTYDETNHKVACVYSDRSLYLWDITDIRKVRTLLRAGSSRYSPSCSLFFFLFLLFTAGWQIAFVFVPRCLHLGRRIVPLFQRRHEGRSAHWLVRDLLE